MSSSTKRGLTLAVCLLVPAFAGAVTPARYRIDLRNGSSVFAKDAPVHRGSILTFHSATGGGLTGIPAEDVVGIRAGDGAALAATPVSASARARATGPVVRGRMSAAQTLSRPLEPGEILVIGPTGSGSAQAMGQNGYGNANTAAMNNGNAGNAANGYGANGAVPPGFAANGQPFVPAPGDLARAPSGNPPTMGANGFPLDGNPTTVNNGPNGTPVIAGSSQTAQPGANQPIGPNGTPLTGTPGLQPGGTQPIGPNGFPTTGTTGTTAAPGSAQPATPNGAQAPAGNTTSGNPAQNANPSGAKSSGGNAPSSHP